VLFAALSFWPANLMPQGQVQSGVGRYDIGNQLESHQTYRLVAGTVYMPSGDPAVHARVEITNNAGAPYHDLSTDNRGEFRADFNLLGQTEEIKHFIVTVKVTKKGFQTARRYAEMEESDHQIGFAIALHPIQPEDATVLSQADLINGVAPRLRKLGPSDGLSAKEEKDYSRGVQEFLDRSHPDQAVPYLDKVVRLDHSCLKCRTMLALAELSWGDWDDSPHELEQAINALIADRKLGSAEPLLTYGVLLSWRHEPEKAIAYFTEALKYAPQDALVYQELGRVQCMELNWYSGSESLKKALAAGAGPEARLMRAEALVWAGTPDEATTELNLYLNGRDLRNAPPLARSILANIQARKKDEAAFRAQSFKAQARGEKPLDYLHHPPQNLPDFEPAADQAPMDGILAAVGKNVAELVSDLPNICSVEKVQQESLSRKGKTGSVQEHKYRYLALAPDHPWGPSVNEYRADSTGTETPQLGLSDNSMLTSGFISAPLVFHPAYQSGSSFRLLGRQKVKGRNTFVIAFAQDPAKSRLSGNFQRGMDISTTYSQGLAWIDSENYQIIRLTSDLLRPLPLVRLDKITTEIDFSEVQFKQPAQKFWLPQAVTVTLGWNGRVYRNRHAYSDFLVSNVDSTEKIAKPKGAEKTVEVTVDPAPGSDPGEKHSLSLVPPAR
jgi:tetratricopeptide (TPR) repeat protein